MKKNVFGLILAAAFVLSGCGVSDYEEEIENATIVADKVVDATKALAGDVADAAGIDKSEVKEAIKDATSDIKEQAKDVAGELTDKAIDASKEAVKDYARKKIDDMTQKALEPDSDDQEQGILEDALDISLTDADGAGTNYTFTYDGETFRAIYTPDNWKIFDSYRIVNAQDMLIICQALIDEHPVHGKDMESFRTAQDMVYEWNVHNIAYTYLEDGDPLREHARDVDFDPKDQGMTLEEFYKSRTGKDLDISEYLNG